MPSLNARAGRGLRSLVLSAGALAAPLFFVAKAHAAETQVPLTFVDYHLGEGSKTLIPAGCNERRDPRTQDLTVLRFTDIASEQAEIRTTGTSVVVTLRGTGDRITTSFFRVRGEDCFEGVREIRFADGITVTRDGELRQRLLGSRSRDVLRGSDTDETLRGEEGDDDLYGYGGADILNGGEGDDDRMGDEGDDTYEFEGHFGRDVVNDKDSRRGHDSAVFFDLRSRDVTFSRDGSDLVVESRRDAGDRVRFEWYFGAPEGNRDDHTIESLRFLDKDLTPFDLRSLVREGVVR